METNGTCECTHGIFNPEYTNDENYCLNSIDESSKPKIEHTSHSHHITLILLITLILIIAGCIFVCKTSLSRRTHSRPLYEDVMLTNDDDPPII